MKFKKVNYILIIMIFLSLAISSNSVFAEEVNGNKFNDIQLAIDNSNHGNTIKLQNKTYSPTSHDDTIRIDNKKNITIQGSSANNLATLDAKNLCRIFRIGNDSSVTFKYISFLNGNSSTGSGAGILAYGKVTVESCSFINNKGESGSAVFLTSNSNYSSFNNCQFLNNRGIYPSSDNWIEGGGIDTHCSYTSIMNCLFKNNYAANVGGAVNFAGSTRGHSLINCEFLNNNASSGGAVRIFETVATIRNCTFKNNAATNGGAIYISDSNVRISDSKFENNIAKNNGGGIYNIVNNNALNYLNISLSKFNKNTGKYGGAIYSSGILNIDSTNITNNIANNNGYGGGLYLKAKATIKSNTKFTNNTANWGSAIFSYNNLDIKSTSFSNNKAKSQRMDIWLLKGRVDSKGRANVTVTLYTGNNALNAIYSHANVYYNGKTVSKTTKTANQIITLTKDNKKYKSRTNEDGVAIFKINNFNLKGTSILKAESSDSNLCTKIANSSKVKVNQKTTHKNLKKTKILTINEKYIINYRTGLLGNRKANIAQTNSFTKFTTTTYTTINGITKKVLNSSVKNIVVEKYNVPKNVAPSHGVYCSCGTVGYGAGAKRILFLNLCPFGSQSSHKIKSTKLVWNIKKVIEKEGEWTCSGCGADFCAVSGKEKLSSSKVYLKKAK